MKANTKEWIQYGSAIAALVSGIVLVFVSFFIKGDVTGNCLVYTGQVLVYSGGIYGISLYTKDLVSKEIGKLKKEKEKENKP